MTDTPDIFANADMIPKPTQAMPQTYIDDYEQFMNSFRLKEVSPEEVGLIIARFGQYFIRHNLVAQRALRVYAQVKRDLMNQVDVAGKAITATKAESLADATPEAAAYGEARAHVQNIEQCLNALKALQKGVLQEFSYSST